MLSPPSIKVEKKIRIDPQRRTNGLNTAAAPSAILRMPTSLGCTRSERKKIGNSILPLFARRADGSGLLLI
jgi:hypothetical protein